MAGFGQHRFRLTVAPTSCRGQWVNDIQTSGIAYHLHYTAEPNYLNSIIFFYRCPLG